MSERPIALALGQVGIEIACRVPSTTGETGGPVEMDQISIQVGGTAAIAAASAAALGCRVRLACKLAGDFLGQHVRSALSGFGIDTRCSIVEHGQMSPLRFNAVSERTRAVYTTRGDVEPLSATEIDPDDLLLGVGAVLIDGTCPSAQVALADAAVRRRIPVLFDGGQIREGVGTLVGLSDVLICSERLASELAPRDDLETSLVEIQRLGPRAVIITLGEAGSIGLHGEQLVRQPAFPVDALDSSGAGAVYHGAFAAALLAQLPFAACMTFASAAASLSCRRLGGFAGIPHREEVVSLIRSPSVP
ncbi:MAG TPA: PfkB family carbohydrate kinase [Kofleriaceae bacterium]|nr:PfkB family carbohydrate kinase [Kofleriaceae bacterium]